MALARQAQQIRLALRSENDASGFLDRVEYYVTLQDKDISIEPEFYGGNSFDQTIGAKRVSNLRGFRVGISLGYQLSQEITRRVVYNSNAQTSDSTSTFREMFNELMSAFKTGTFDTSGTAKTLDGLNIYVLQTNGQWNAIQDATGTFVAFIPTEMSYQQNYTNQIGRFTPSITLTAATLLDSIQGGLEGTV